MLVLNYERVGITSCELWSQGHLKISHQRVNYWKILRSNCEGKLSRFCVRFYEDSSNRWQQWNWRNAYQTWVKYKIGLHLDTFVCFIELVWCIGTYEILSKSAPSSGPPGEITRAQKSIWIQNNCVFYPGLITVCSREMYIDENKNSH